MNIRLLLCFILSGNIYISATEQTSVQMLEIKQPLLLEDGKDALDRDQQALDAGVERILRQSDARSPVRQGMIDDGQSRRLRALQLRQQNNEPCCRRCTADICEGASNGVIIALGCMCIVCPEWFQ